MVIPDIQEAVTLIERGQHAEAIPLLEQLTQRMPMYVTADVLLARAYEAAERWDDALAAWQRARFLMPNSFTVREGLQRVQDLLTMAAYAEEQDPEDTSLGLDLFWDETREAFISPEEDRLGDDGLVLSLGGDLPEDLDAASAAEAALAAEAHTLTLQDTADREAEEGTLAAVEAALAAEDKAIPDPDEEPYDAAADMTLAAEALEAAADDELVVEGWEELEELFEVPEPESAASPASSGDLDDLDRLIDELETARIFPRPDLDDIPAPDLEDEIDDMVSETLARIFASQKQYEEAARIYDQLARQQPGQAEAFLEQASAMRALASGGKNAEEPSGES